MRLTIENYGIIENLELMLEPGLTALIGPNGSGKSTAVDALFFALTGETIDGRNLDERINWGAAPAIAKVELDAGDFKVTRTIKPASVSHVLIYRDTKITKKAEVNEFIFNRWNVQTTSQLKDVFFAAQLKATELFDSTDAVRLGMLSKVFGFDRLEKGRTAIYNVLSNTQVPAVNEERIAQLQGELEDLNGKVEVALNDFNIAKQELLSVSFDQEEYDRVIAAPLDSQRSLLEQELQQKRELQAQLKDDYDRVAVLTDTKTKLEDQLRGSTAYKTFKAAEEALTHQIKDLDDGGPSAEAVYAALQELDKRRVPILTEMQELKKNLQFDGATCPLTQGAACIDLLRLHDKETIMRRQKELEAQLQELDSDAEQLKALLDERTQHGLVVAKVTAELEALVKSAPQMIEDLTDQQLKELEKVNEELAGCVESNMSVLQAKLQECNKRIHELEGLLSSETATVTEEQKKYQQDLFAKHTAAVSKLAIASNVLKGAKDAAANLGKMLASMLQDAEEAKDIQHRVSVLRTVRDILSRDQLQRVLLQSTIRRINKEIEVCAKIFSFPFTIRVADTGAISFSTDDADDKNVAFLSGGQKYVAAVIVRLAFSRVLRSTFPFVVLDEPSTCLDDNSREMLAELMAAMAKRSEESGLCLVVPTHDQLIVNVSNKIVNVGE